MWIEVTYMGEKQLVNFDTVSEVRPLDKGCKLFFNGLTPDGEDIDIIINDD